jgi:alanyl-tRNA synthetase
MTPEQIAEVENFINEKIEANVPVVWKERPYAEVKGDPSILQFFGDKYGEKVRVVSMGNFSHELCAGTHVRQSGDIGFFKILSESAIAAGIRRIEAVSGGALIHYVEEQFPKQDAHHSTLRQRKLDLIALNAFSGDPTPPLLWRHWESREQTIKRDLAHVLQHEKEEARRREAHLQERAAAEVELLLPQAVQLSGISFLAKSWPETPSALLPLVADLLKTRWQGVAVFAAEENGKAALLCSVSPEFSKKIHAGKIIQAIAPLVGGKGGGRPELAQGGGANVQGIRPALELAEETVRRAAG